MATKKMKLRRDGVCDRCEVPLPAGTYAVYDNSSRSVRCVTHDELPGSPADAPAEVPSVTDVHPGEVDRKGSQLLPPPRLSRPPLLSRPEGLSPAGSVLPATRVETKPASADEVELPGDELLEPRDAAELSLPGALLAGSSELPAADDSSEVGVPPAATASTAGSSARREYERRKAKDEAKIREQWGTLGGLAVALSSEKQTTKAWDKGAIGEEKLGRLLDSLSGDGVAVLHDRRIPKTKANIDHIVVSPGGVWVVDAKRYKGRPELRVEGGLLRPRVEKLVVGGSDRTKLVEGVLWQVGLVASEVEELVSVHGVLCFVDADWPMFGGSFTISGLNVCWPTQLAKLLKADAGELDVPAVAARLAAHFPAA